MAAWVLHFDGLYEPRSSERGIATYGFVVRRADVLGPEGRGQAASQGGGVLGPDGRGQAASQRGGEVLAAEHGLLAGPGEGGTANVAELGAMAHGLDWVARRKDDEDPLLVRGDSRLAIETVAGRWDLKSARLLPLRDLAVAQLREIPGDKTLEKVSREANAEADALSRIAYHQAAAALRRGLSSARPRRTEDAAAHPEWGLGIHSKTARKRRA